MVVVAASQDGQGQFVANLVQRKFYIFSVVICSLNLVFFLDICTVIDVRSRVSARYVQNAFQYVRMTYMDIVALSERRVLRS